MKLKGIVEEIQRAFGGGKSPADNKFNDMDYMFQLIDEASAETIALTYNGGKLPNSDTVFAANKTIGSKTWLEFDLTLNPSLQETGACYTVFECPDPIMINTMKSGHAFVGDKNTMAQFSEVRDPSEFASLSRMTNLEGLYYNQVNGILKLIGQNKQSKARDVNQAHVISRPISPLKLAVTYYNPITQDYPLPDELIPRMIQVLKVRLLQQEFATPQDNIADNNPNMTR